MSTNANYRRAADKVTRAMYAEKWTNMEVAAKYVRYGAYTRRDGCYCFLHSKVDCSINGKYVINAPCSEREENYGHIVAVDQSVASPIQKMMNPRDSRCGKFSMDESEKKTARSQTCNKLLVWSDVGDGRACL